MTDIADDPCCWDARANGVVHDALTHQLRARLAEVEAERDAARRSADEWQQLIAGRAFLAAENARLRRERDLDRSAVVNLRNARDAMRPVVEEAEALVDGWAARLVGVSGLDLTAAVDAYRAGQNRPASPPETTLGAEQAEPAVASTNTPEAQRGPQGGREPTLAEAMAIAVGAMPSDARFSRPPADPPGLDAAIEAAVCRGCGRPTVDHMQSTDQPGWLDVALDVAFNAVVTVDSPIGDYAIVANAVRAAAPALRAGALREAADEMPYSWSRGWLRERADRIGGAT